MERIVIEVNVRDYIDYKATHTRVEYTLIQDFLSSSITDCSSFSISNNAVSDCILIPLYILYNYLVIPY